MKKLKYNSPQEWKKENLYAYRAALRNGWLPEIYEKLGWNQRFLWIKEECIKDAKKYNTRKEWSDNNGSAYSAALRYEWLEECCVHMTAIAKPKNYWTKERCIEDAKKYSSIKDWREGEKSGYVSALAYGWLLECSGHMSYVKTPNGYWTKERCVEDAKKYKSIKEWKKGSKGGAYLRALRNNWLEDCCSHMETYLKQQKSIKTPKNTYTKEYCMQDAKKYTRIIDWYNNSKLVYYAVQRNGWSKECTNHMNKKHDRKHRDYWNEETIIESAKKFKKIGEWRKVYSTAYNVAVKLKIMGKCFDKHFERKKPQQTPKPPSQTPNS